MSTVTEDNLHNECDSGNSADFPENVPIQTRSVIIWHFPAMCTLKI